MSDLTDEMRDLANEQDAGSNGPDFKAALRAAADFLDEAEKALANLVFAADQSGICDDVMSQFFPDAERHGKPRDGLAHEARRAMNEARATLARIRGGKP